jgi:hypothetical protein
MQLQGWGELADLLNQYSWRTRRNDMAVFISDEILETFAVIATNETLAEALHTRYDDILDRVTIYKSCQPGALDSFRKNLAADLLGLC